MKRHIFNPSPLCCGLVIMLAVMSLSCAGSGRIGGRAARDSKINGSVDRYAEMERPAREKAKKDSRSSGVPGPSGKDGEVEPPDRRMVVYRGECTVAVRSVSESLGEIEGIVSRFNGFIESSATSDSYRRARVVIRVPAGHFDEAFALVTNLGTVLKRQVSAADVTMEYHDLSMRIGTAKKLRGRMYELLKRTRSVKDRVKILREIERLTGIIETARARLEYLKSRADFSTIIITLRAGVRDTVTRYVPSPFSWIANLRHDRRSIFDRGRGISYETPAGFYRLNDKYYKNMENCYLFSNPGGTVKIRPGRVKNHPPADLRFWKSALELDMKNRHSEQLLKREITAAGGLALARYDFRLPGGKRYSVTIGTVKKHVLVVEALFLDESAYKKEGKRLDEFLKSVRFK